MQKTIAMALLVSILCFDACLAIPTFGLPEWMIPRSNKDVLEIGAMVKEHANEEELDVLRTLLMERSNWHPKAKETYEAVMNRRGAGARRLAPSCSDLTTNETCTGAFREDYSGDCQSCHWTGSYCAKPECYEYNSQESCCANAYKIGTGCRWNIDFTSQGFCQPNDCGGMTAKICPGSSSWVSDNLCAAANTRCSGATNCQFSSFAGCVDAGLTCTQLGESGHMCSHPSDGSDGLSLLLCPMMACTMCLKGCEPIAERLAKRTGECASQCSSSIHCDDETKCLMDGVEGFFCVSLGGTTVVEQTKCSQNPPAPPASCSTVAWTSTTTTTTGNFTTCGGMCANFESVCAGSCGATATCASTSASDRQVATGVGTIFSSMIALLW